MDQTEARPLEGAEATGEEEATKVAAAAEVATKMCASVSDEAVTGVPQEE